ncbi:hypothetical protein AXF42_Ash018439 [Apostasia shenzhenica]|uniref:PB1 domain-containing protein n=1 Tax=Apostasia shenzhenica TaxID=1088818 RepID=A0A2I0BED8_9ASPA|nr:hypothetical protein AXF42_Ash018439 [Apostasia shenzhenica]
MVGTSSSSSSSCASFGSFDDIPVKACTVVKFLCSYGGRILPRYPDGRLRYMGGETRVLSIDRSATFSDLQAKLGEMCGWETVNLRCQLPTEDLDALVSVTSNEDLANLIEEYDLASRDRQSPLKIRAFLHPSPMKSPKSITPAGTISRAVMAAAAAAAWGKAPFQHPLHQKTKCPVRSGRSGGDFRFHGGYGHGSSAAPPQCLVHHGNHWQ